MLDHEIKFLRGVGEKRAAVLASELGIRTCRDLLYHFPFRYIDRSRIYRIAEITDETAANYIQIRARVVGMKMAGERAKKRLIVEVADASGIAELVWFKGISWVQKRMKIGDEYLIFGRPSIFNGRPDFIHPEMESTHLTESQQRLKVPVQGVYSTTEKLNSNSLGTKAIYGLMCTLWLQVEAQIEETLPETLLRANGLIPLREALFNIHFPRSTAQLEQARYRLKFEELLGIQLNLLSQRNQRTGQNRGHIFSRVGTAFNRFYRERMPFELTDAQKRVIREIRDDVASGHQMNRLLQGDVGSGKTMVALMVMLLAVDNGFQSAIMAPTEILAQQHYESIREMLGELPIRVGLLTGSTRKKVRESLLTELAEGKIDLLIGTHALIEERVQFANLGMVVIDEQHRFGVEQRSRLWSKGQSLLPHILVMTATPIPRTLAMTLYGDLNVSVIDQLPPGRKPVRTLHFTDAKRLRVFGFMRDQIHAGRQIYVVFPLIKESEKFDYKDLEDGCEGIMRAFPPPEYVSVVVHGKMKPADKEFGMDLFKRGQAQIMIATSVIEVGVNVPNATVMIIESAERFGLSQLHQLRGRVGRGADQSYCILMTGEKLSTDSRKRMRAMVETTDGFELAELDLKLRGPGDLSGTQQSGLAFDLKIADLAHDGQIIEMTRRLAEEILSADPALQTPPNARYAALKSRYMSRDALDFSMIS